MAITLGFDVYGTLIDTAGIASALIGHGVEVWISNHRSVDGILDYIRRLGALVSAADKARA
jgi:iron complex transport system substrate-binding protein